MRATSYKTVQFTLDESEKKIMTDALEIMRKVKNKFLTSDMPTHQKHVEELMSLMNNVISSKEISE